MARPLGYIPPTPSYDPARHEVDDLVAALHEAGLLRALAGAARTYPELLEPLLAAADAGTVRSVIELGGALTHLDPETSKRVATGIRDARSAVASAGDAAPEGPVKLWRRLRDPDTRRGLAVVLAALSALGGALGERDDPRDDRHPRRP